VPIVLKSGSLNLLEPSGPVKGCNGVALHYWWPNMRREIEQDVEQCKSCQVNKTLKPKRKAPMEITSTANCPFEKSYLDLINMPGKMSLAV
jgi:hypothetical protein